jgi:hypothetical protein
MLQLHELPTKRYFSGWVDRVHLRDPILR